MSLILLMLDNRQMTPSNGKLAYLFDMEPEIRSYAGVINPSDIINHIKVY